MATGKSESKAVHHCKGQNGWCGRRIDSADWAAGLRRCPVCRSEAKRKSQQKGN